MASGHKHEAAKTRTAPGREEFVLRLTSALTAAGCELTATKLVKSFNLRYPSEAVTIQAARKWLLGDAYPSEPKLLALAHWLKVDAAWLRFGETERHPHPDFSDASADGLERDIAALSNVERLLVRQMLDLILAGRLPRGR